MNNSAKTVIAGVGGLILAATSSIALADKPDPRIDFGHRFEVRIQNSVDRGGKKPIGTSTFVLGFHVENGSRDDSIAVTFSQKGKKLATASCTPKKAKYATRCESAAIPARSIKTSAPVEVSYVYENATTDARSELANLELEVLGTKDWIGNQGNKPTHVEHRHLRMDGALGLMLLEDQSDAPVYNRDKEAYLRVWYWDVHTEETRGKWSLRCRIDGGDWRGFKIGRPSPGHGPETRVQNRVWSRKTKDAVTENLDYKRYAFNVNMPFSVSGARAIDNPESVDGNWQCQLRRAGDSGKEIVREMAFAVKDNVAQPHAAQGALYLGPKRIATTVSFGDSKLAAFDPGQVSHPYGIKADIAGLIDGAPKKRITPRFSK